MSDPGIDGAVAVALALLDPDIDLLGLAATAGNVPPEQATRNVHILIEQLDPARWPRSGRPARRVRQGRHTAARARRPRRRGLPLRRATPPAPQRQVTQRPGPPAPQGGDGVAAGAGDGLRPRLDRDPDLATLVERLVGRRRRLARAGRRRPVVEFHFACDPAAARQALRCSAAP